MELIKLVVAQLLKEFSAFYEILETQFEKVTIRSERIIYYLFPKSLTFETQWSLYVPPALTY
jgi:hypothetical protein